ncbi:MAG: hypothetical protein HUU55_11315 [Myxococcales bacterium]|nr:hypothetical protein [Myxococcales bacterium]
MTKQAVWYWCILCGLVFLIANTGCEESTSGNNDADVEDATAEPDVNNDGTLPDGSSTDTKLPVDVLNNHDGEEQPLDVIEPQDINDFQQDDTAVVGEDSSVHDVTNADELQTCVPTGPTFSVIYDKVIKLSCVFASCHGAAPAKKNGYLDLRKDVAWESMVGKLATNPAAAAQGLQLVDPCLPDQSFLVLKLELPEGGDPEYGGPMPKVNGGGLPSETIQLVKDWIAAGAKND